MLIHRYLEDHIRARLEPGRVAVIYGPRRSGKTTIMGQLLQDYDPSQVLSLRGDSLETAQLVANNTVSTEKIKSWLTPYAVLAIDEAQDIQSIGHMLKNIVDVMAGLIIIVSGSSSFDLSQQVGEPLVGRKTTHMLYPFSYYELHKGSSTPSGLEGLMIYGGYPRVSLAVSALDKQSELKELTDSYLFKDILMFEGLKNAKKVRDLIELVAFQVGSELSVNKIADTLGLTRLLVERYLDLFEKSFILFSIGGLSRNLRKEVYKYRKYYFYDLGVRNAIIRNFSPIAHRDDIGALWENFCILEKRKYNDQRQELYNQFFWRTYDQQEIDLVEEGAGILHAYEFKWKDDHARAPLAFVNAYPNNTFRVVNHLNVFDSFLKP
jgi:uncharacterized protein